jgi:hypothetical protein
LALNSDSRAIFVFFPATNAGDTCIASKPRRFITSPWPRKLVTIPGIFAEKGHVFEEHTLERVPTALHFHYQRVPKMTD